MSQHMMRAELKRLHSPDVRDLKDFRPNGPFGLLVQAMVGPLHAHGEESFDIFVCSADWLVQHMDEKVMSGRSFLFMKTYDFDTLFGFIQKYCAGCEGKTWQSVAQQVGRIGKWEFEDFTP